MPDSKRFFTVGKQIALMCATLLLFVVSVSGSRTSEVGSRLTAQALRQAIGLRAQNLRRPVNAQTRAAKLDRAGTESGCTSVTVGASTELAWLYAWELLIQPTYRVLPPDTFHEIELRERDGRVNVERARAPPSLVS